MCATGVELIIISGAEHVNVNHASISRVKHPLYVFRGHGRRAGRRFQKYVIALAHEAGFLELRSGRTETRGEEADQFLFLFRRQRLRGSFNLEQCAHVESLSLTNWRGKSENSPVQPAARGNTKQSKK